MTFDVFLLFMQQGIASGLVTGSVYALLAIAIVIVFRTTDVANFAEGEVYMASAYLAFFLIAMHGSAVLGRGAGDGTRHLRRRPRFSSGLSSRK